MSQQRQPATVQYISPDGLHKNPAYSQAVIVSGPAKTIYVGGQNAMDRNGAIVGKGDLRAQTEQILRNIEIALAAGGAKPEHIVKLNIHVLQGQSLLAGLAAFRAVWGNPPNPPTITGMFMAALAHPDFLAEIDAIAVVP